MTEKKAYALVDAIYSWLKEIELINEDDIYGILDNAVSTAGNWYIRLFDKQNKPLTVIKVFDLDAYIIDDETNEAVVMFNDFIAFGNTDNGSLFVSDDTDEIITKVAATLVCIFDKLGLFRIYK